MLMFWQSIKKTNRCAPPLAVSPPLWLLFPHQLHVYWSQPPGSLGSWETRRHDSVPGWHAGSVQPRWHSGNTRRKDGSRVCYPAAGITLTCNTKKYTCSQHTFGKQTTDYWKVRQYLYDIITEELSQIIYN